MAPFALQDSVSPAYLWLIGWALHITSHRLCRESLAPWLSLPNIRYLL
jgi:hypothetical protein